MSAPPALFQKPIYDRNHPEYKGYVIRKVDDETSVAFPAGILDSEIEELIEEIKLIQYLDKEK